MRLLPCGPRAVLVEFDDVDAVMDASTLGKIDIQGPDAAEFLDLLDVPPGFLGKIGGEPLQIVLLGPVSRDPQLRAARHPSLRRETRALRAQRHAGTRQAARNPPRLAPARVAGLMMGVWFLAASVGNFIGGRLASFYGTIPLPQLFGAVAVVGIAAGIVLLLAARPIERMLDASVAE